MERLRRVFAGKGGMANVELQIAMNAAIVNVSELVLNCSMVWGTTAQAMVSRSRCRPEVITVETVLKQPRRTAISSNRSRV